MIKTGETVAHCRFGVGITTTDEFTGTNGMRQVRIYTGSDGYIHKVQLSTLRPLAIGDTRTCPDCGRPQHYTGTEHGWCHDAPVDTWHCADPRKAGA